MRAPTPARNLQDLLDRAAISDLARCYASGIDRRDWALYRSIFTDRIEVDFSTWRGVREAMDADAWVASVIATLACFDATEHSIVNHVIALDGDRATLTAHMVARHVFEGEMQQLGGYYEHQLVRVGDHWKIAACRLVIQWELGDRALFERAARRGPCPRVGDPDDH